MLVYNLQVPANQEFGLTITQQIRDDTTRNAVEAIVNKQRDVRYLGRSPRSRRSGEIATTRSRRSSRELQGSAAWWNQRCGAHSIGTEVLGSSQLGPNPGPSGYTGTPVPTIRHMTIKPPPRKRRVDTSVERRLDSLDARLNCGVPQQESKKSTATMWSSSLVAAKNAPVTRPTTSEQVTQEPQQASASALSLAAATGEELQAAPGPDHRDETESKEAPTQGVGASSKEKDPRRLLLRLTGGDRAKLVRFQQALDALLARHQRADQLASLESTTDVANGDPQASLSSGLNPRAQVPLWHQPLPRLTNPNQM